MDQAQPKLNKLARIAERQLDRAREAFASALAMLAKDGMLNSGARVKRVVGLLGENMAETTRELFQAVHAFPGQNDINRQVYGPDVARILNAHLEALVAAAPTSPGPAFSGGVERATNELIDKVRQQLAGDLEEFRAGLWTAGAAPASSSSMTSNTVTVMGNVNGPLQLAGSHATQTAHQQININEAKEAIASFEARLVELEIAAEAKAEVAADLQTIKAQLSKASPNAGIIGFAVESVKALAYGVAGNLLTPELTHLLAVLGHAM